MEQPFRITVYDKTFTREGWASRPLSLKLTLRHNAISDCSFTLTADHHMIPALTSPGSRIAVDWRGSRVFSGEVVWQGGEGPEFNPQMTFTAESDLRVVSHAIAWPKYVTVNGPPVQAERSDYRRGPAETVLKHFIAVNHRDRLGIMQIVPTLGRGADISATLHWQDILSEVVPLVDAAGLGVTVYQKDGVGLELDVYEPTHYPVKLTERSGAILRWQWSRTSPTATRAIVSGHGEEEMKEMFLYVDAAREAEYGYAIEVFKSGASAGGDYGQRRDEADRALDQVSNADKAKRLAKIEWDKAKEALAADPGNVQKQNDENNAEDQYNREVADYNAAVAAYNTAKGAHEALRGGYESDLEAAGNDALLAGAPRAGLTLTLSETDVFRYDPTGVNGVRVGDTIDFELASGVVIRERLREIEVSWTPDQGLTTTPVVGERQDDPSRTFAKAIATLARGFQKLLTSR